jgi:formate dehydrogenase maturation protein FdhE
VFVDKTRPGVNGVRRAVTSYSRLYPEYADTLAIYGRILEVQQEALETLPRPDILHPHVVDSRLRQGMTLVEPVDVRIEEETFLGLVADICDALETKIPDGFREKLLGEEGLGAGIYGPIDAVLSNSTPGIFEGDDDDLASRVIFEALVPYFEILANEYQGIMDWSIWRRGHCPVCGAPPLMGKLREEDSLWILECSLCRAAWSVKRARCPFCDQGDDSSLEFLHLDGDDSHRIMYCPACHRYIKTVDLKNAGHDAILSLEDIVTAELDKAAAHEGLEPA